MPSKLYLEAPDVEDVLHELRKQRDRAVGVLGGALVDDSLKGAITCLWLSDGSKRTKEATYKVVGDAGALTFGVKIDIAYLSGIVGPKVHEDLLLVNKIRNRFAHRTMMDNPQRVPAAVSFKTQQIKDLCSNFFTVDDVAVFIDKKRQPTKLARHRFILTTIALYWLLGVYADPEHKELVGQFLKS